MVVMFAGMVVWAETRATPRARMAVVKDFIMTRFIDVYACK